MHYVSPPFKDGIKLGDGKYLVDSAWLRDKAKYHGKKCQFFIRLFGRTLCQFSPAELTHLVPVNEVRITITGPYVIIDSPERVGCIHCSDDYFEDVFKDVEFVGICGRKQAGKDTFRKGIVQQLDSLKDINADDGGEGYLPFDVSMGNSLKRACMAIFGGRHENYWGTDDDKNERAEPWATILGPEWSTYRKIMQQFGTEICRNHIFQGIWTASVDTYLAKQLKSHRQVHPKRKCVVVCPDVRYPNEADYIIRRGGTLVKVINLNQPDENPDAHSSELGVDDSLMDHIFKSSDAETTRQMGADFAEENL